MSDPTQSEPSPSSDIGQIADLDPGPEIVAGSSRISEAARKLIQEAGKRSANGEPVAGQFLVADLDAPDLDTLGDDVAPAPAPKAAPAAKVTPAPAPDPDPKPAADMIARWDAIAEQTKALEAREAALRARETQAADVSERLASDPLGTMRALAKARLGDDATEDEIDGEVGYLVTDMSLRLAKVEPDPKDVPGQLRKIQRELAQAKIEKRRAAAQAEAEAKRRADLEAQTTASKRAEAQYQAALATVKREFVAELDVSGQPVEPMTKKYPFLALEDDFEAKIFQLIKEDHDDQVAAKGAGQVQILTIAEAAKHLDDALAARDRERFTKRRHLLQPADQAPRNGSEHQGGQPRKARSLTVEDASEDAPPPARRGLRTPAEDRAETLEALRRSGTFRKLREAAQTGE